jgi:hypothetical protein
MGAAWGAQRGCMGLGAVLRRGRCRLLQRNISKLVRSWVACRAWDASLVALHEMLRDWPHGLQASVQEQMQHRHREPYPY